MRYITVDDRCDLTSCSEKPLSIVLNPPSHRQLTTDMNGCWINKFCSVIALKRRIWCPLDRTSDFPGVHLAVVLLLGLFPGWSDRVTPATQLVKTCVTGNLNGRLQRRFHTLLTKVTRETLNPFVTRVRMYPVLSRNTFIILFSWNVSDLIAAVVCSHRSSRPPGSGRFGSTSEPTPPEKRPFRPWELDASATTSPPFGLTTLGFTPLFLLLSPPFFDGMGFFATPGHAHLE